MAGNTNWLLCNTKKLLRNTKWLGCSTKQVLRNTNWWPVIQTDWFVVQSNYFVIQIDYVVIQNKYFVIQTELRMPARCLPQWYGLHSGMQDASSSVSNVFVNNRWYMPNHRHTMQLGLADCVCAPTTTYDSIFCCSGTDTESPSPSCMRCRWFGMPNRCFTNTFDPPDEAFCIPQCSPYHRGRHRAGTLNSG